MTIQDLIDYCKKEKLPLDSELWIDETGWPIYHIPLGVKNKLGKIIVVVDRGGMGS